MQIFRDIETIPDIGETIATVGSFDGVHSGHSSLLELLRTRALATGRRSVVVSFSRHPRVTLGRGEGLKLLSGEAEKAELLRNKGIDVLLLIDFDKELSHQSYQQFIDCYLLTELNMRELIIGFNHHMGHNGGNAESITEYGAQRGFAVTIATEHSQSSHKISSTTIRRHIEKGDIALANELLGYEYMIMGETSAAGEVLVAEPLKLLPPPGEYIATIDGTMQQLRIDNDQRIWCERYNQTVQIKLRDRYEK